MAEEAVKKWYPGEGKVTPARAVLYVLVMLGLISGIIRLFFGLGATTNLSDGYPWGLWISFDILAGVALAGGGFTMAATIYIFNLKKFEPLLRPAKISAFLGYLMFIVGLFLDLGQPWRIWHPMIMWNPQSVLFEVAWCVMLYTMVLGTDVLIMALERWKMESWSSSSGKSTSSWWWPASSSPPCTSPPWGPSTSCSPRRCPTSGPPAPSGLCSS